MKSRKLLSVLLALAMTLSLMMLASCGADEEQDDAEAATDNTYTLTIVDNNGDPVVGAAVLFSDGSYKQATTDANGKATVELEGDTVSVTITSLPSGCEKPDATIDGMFHGRFAAGEKNLTITVQRTSSATVTYTVKVVDQNGDEVENAYVQVCHGSICESAKPTNADGEMKIELAEGLALDVKISSLPSGYTKPAEINSDGYHASMEAGETEITVTVTRD